jgi:hypothetical protein
MPTTATSEGVRGIAVEEDDRDGERRHERRLEPGPADEDGEVVRAAGEEDRVRGVGREEHRPDREGGPGRAPAHEEVVREVDGDEDRNDEPAQPQEPVKPLGEVGREDVVRPGCDRLLHVPWTPRSAPERGVYAIVGQGTKRRDAPERGRAPWSGDGGAGPGMG